MTDPTPTEDGYLRFCLAQAKAHLRVGAPLRALKLVAQAWTYLQRRGALTTERRAALCEAYRVLVERAGRN